MTSCLQLDSLLEKHLGPSLGGVLLAAALSLHVEGLKVPAATISVKTRTLPKPLARDYCLRKMHAKHVPVLHPSLTSLILMKADYKTQIHHLSL